MQTLLRQIQDGFGEVPLPHAEALRAAISWLMPMAALHLLLDSFALIGESAMFAAGTLIACVQPLSALLIFLAGLQLNRAHRPHGALMMAAAAVYVFLALVPFLVGAEEPLVFGLFTVAFFGPIVGMVTFALLASAIRRCAPRGEPAHIAWGIGLAFPLAPLLSLPAAIWGGERAMMVAWVFAPQAATALACSLAYRHMRASPAELDLLRVVERTDLAGFELVRDTHPVGLTARLSIPNPTFERAQDAGTPLGNPVLDELLPLTAQHPHALAKLLSGNEATVLAVLHAWPQSELRDGTLHWQASLSELEQRGPDLAQTLAQVHGEMAALQLLLSSDYLALQPQG